MKDNSITLTQQQLAELIAGLKPPADVLKGDTMPYGSYLLKWFFNHTEWTPKTKETYKGMIDNHINPRFGDVMMSDITFEDLEDFMHEKGETLSPATMEKMQSCIIKASFRDAMRQHYIKENPAEYLRPLRVHNKTKRALKDEELNDLIRVSHSHRLGYTIPLLLGTGMRRAEMLALTWEDVDFATCTIYVNKDYVSTAHESLIRETKNEGSVRAVSFPSYLVETLRHIKERDNHSFVVSQAKQDKRIEPHNYNRLFRSWCKKAALVDVSPHSMRVMYCTIANELGVSLDTIRRQVGHSSERMLITHYLKQRTNQQQKDAARLMSDFMIHRLIVA